MGATLTMGNGFWDGGRPSVISEEFEIPVPPEGGLLVARYRGSYKGNLQELWADGPVHLLIDDTELRIEANGIPVYQKEVRLDDDFCYLHIPIENGGMTHFTINGLIHSFHYWIYPKDTAIPHEIAPVTL